MTSHAPKSSRPNKPPNQSSLTQVRSSSTSSSLSSHLAMIELKQRILTSLSKLSDRDTHQVAVEDLEMIIQTLTTDGVSMLLNCLYDATNDAKPAVKKESLRLLAVVCATHGDSAATHLTKIIAHIVKRLKDSDSSVKDSCCDSIGALSAQYLKGEGDNGGLVSLFMKPLFETMNDQSKGVQGGSAMCMAKVVECASHPPIVAFQKLCPRICKYLNSPNFLAKAAILPVIARLSQVGAIAPQSLEPMLQSIQECLSSPDWATRKAAAETLSALALNSSNMISDQTASTLSVLEGCRFDKIKPVRDSITEALQLWKKIGGKGGDGSSDGPKTSSHDGEGSDAPELSEKKDPPNSSERRNGTSAKASSNALSPSDSVSKSKAVGLLKKKAPTLTDKEINMEFFQKLETRGSDDVPVEVVVSRRCPKSSNYLNDEESDPNETDLRGRSKGYNGQTDDGNANFRYRNVERGNDGGGFSRQRDFDDRSDTNNQRVNLPKTDGQSQTEGFMNNKGNWLAIQRQLLQLERQQAHLMHMLQDFMGGSHDGMMALENRVRGLERVVEDMSRDLSISTGRRGNSNNYMMGFDDSSNNINNRPLGGKYNGYPEYSSGRSSDGRINNPFRERFGDPRGRAPHSWRSNASESWDYRTYRRDPVDDRSPRSEHESEQFSNRRIWDNNQRGGGPPLRFGEGPSARSVWQASKDEATLEAIRVAAGEDNGTGRTVAAARVPLLPELTAEAMGDEGGGGVQERDPVWNSWSNAMDAVHVGDMDTAFAEVLSTGDDLLLVKLMDRTGPVIDQLSNEVATEVLNAVAQFLTEQNLFDICLSWIQQFVEIGAENGADVLGTPMELKREVLVNLHEACSTIEAPEDWEGVAPDQLLLQLASLWDLNLQNLLNK